MFAIAGGDPETLARRSRPQETLNGLLRTADIYALHNRQRKTLVFLLVVIVEIEGGQCQATGAGKLAEVLDLELAVGDLPVHTAAVGHEIPAGQLRRG